MSARGTSRFDSISRSLCETGLWCFPIRVVRADGHNHKIYLTKWKPFQQGPPSSLVAASWCKEFPNASGGIPTGPATRIFVVDGDTPDGIEWLKLRGMAETWMVRTPRGPHYYHKFPDFDVRNSESKVAPGVDIRGNGGMVVAAGSVVEGPSPPDAYRWEPGHSPHDLPLADAPAWLLSELRRIEARRAPISVPAEPRPYRGRVSAWARKVFEAELARFANAHPGIKNVTARDVAHRLGRLIGGGELDQAEVCAALCAVADAWPNSAHTRDTIQRALEHGRTLPLTAPSQRNCFTSVNWSARRVSA